MHKVKIQGKEKSKNDNFALAGVVGLVGALSHTLKDFWFNPRLGCISLSHIHFSLSLSLPFFSLKINGHILSED